MKTVITIAILLMTLSAHAEMDYGWGTSQEFGQALQNFGNNNYVPTPYGQPDPSYGGEAARKRNGIYMPEPYGGTHEPTCEVVFVKNAFGSWLPRKVCK